MIMNKTSEPTRDESTFVGNRLGSCLDLVGPDKKTLRQKFLIGEPRACAAGSAEEMKRRGYVGIYQKERTVTFRLPQSRFVMEKRW
jgi:hypothetical protein